MRRQGYGNDPQQYANAAYAPGNDCRALFAVTKTQSCFARDEAKKASSRYFYIIHTMLTHTKLKYELQPWVVPFVSERKGNMKFKLYENTADFGREVLELLLEHEVQNNLPIGFIKNERGLDSSNWIMASVCGDNGGVLLTAACTPPHNIVLYETGNKPCDEAIKLLCENIKSLGITLPGVLGEQSLANRFAAAYAGSKYRVHHSMNIMKLDKVNPINKAPGFMRPLEEKDLFFAPYWERAFSEECDIGTVSIPEYTEILKGRIQRGEGFIWEDAIPVSQAATCRSTENGAVINAVYTPPHFRNKGYAAANVAGFSQLLLDRGNQFCCLYADAANPISCGIYRKIGYADQCVMDEIHFDS